MRLTYARKPITSSFGVFFPIGPVGFGEGLPRDYVTGETIKSVMELLKRSDLTPQMESCRDFPAAVAFAESLRLEPIPGDQRGCLGNSARCAVELAILDAFATLSANRCRMSPGKSHRNSISRVRESNTAV